MNQKNGRRTPGPGTTTDKATDPAILADLTLIAEPVYLAVVVSVVTGRTRRTAYFNLPAATKAMARAASRGADARLVLCELVPVEGVQHDAVGTTGR